MFDDLQIASFDIDSSPLMQRIANENYRHVWGYWGDVHESFAAEKSELEKRIADVFKANEPDDLLRFAQSDRSLATGMSGPPHDVTDADPLRVAAVRAVEIALQRALRTRYVAAIEPASETDLVCRKTPGLWDALSRRDGLFPVDSSTWPSECRGNVPYFVFRDRAVYPHPHVIDYRELMRDVVQLGLGGFDAKMAIDPHRSTSRSDACDMLLLDYWFGMKLTLETLDSLAPEHLGETWHMRPAGRSTALTTLPLAATVFRLSAEGHVKTFEIDEIAPLGSWAATEGPYVLNRYLHAQRDTRERRFIHVDGAVRAYDASDYEATQENPQAHRGHPVRYRKLFRVDGSIEDADWGRIVAHFFRSNELVIEYFGDVLDERPGAAPVDEVPSYTVPAVVG